MFNNNGTEITEEVMNKIYEGGYLPVNRSAAIDISPQETDKITLPPKFEREHWDTPPTMREITAEFTNNPSFVDLTGTKFGRRVVVGFAEKRGYDSALWVVRCVCGIYELQTARSITKATAPESCCQCEYHKWLRETEGRKMLDKHDSLSADCPPLDMVMSNKANPNYTQTKFGELTVLGIPLENPKGFRTWVVQCSCGMHERRVIRQVVKKFEANEPLMCAKCKYA